MITDGSHAPDCATIRPAWPDEFKRATSLFRLPLNCSSIVVATISPRDRLVGCAALIDAAPRAEPDGDATPNPNRGQGSAFLLWRLAHDRLDTLDALLKASAEAAAGYGHPELVTLDFIEDKDSSPVRDSLASLGFQRAEQMHEFKVPMTRVYERVCRAYDRLAARGTIPPGIRIACLDPDLVPEVRRIIHVAGLLDAVDFDARLAGRATTAISPELCTVIVAGGTIIGIHLVERLDDGFIIPCRWVHKNHRSTWVNVGLMHWSTQRDTPPDPEESFVRFSFSSEQHHETQRFAKRMGASPVGSRTRWVLRLKT